MIHVYIYKAKDGWRWRMIRSGRIIAESGEGYKRRSSCKRTVKNLIDADKWKFQFD